MFVCSIFKDSYTDVNCYIMYSYVHLHSYNMFCRIEDYIILRVSKMLPMKADLAICSRHWCVWIVLGCGFHVKLYTSCVVMIMFG